MKRGEYIGVSGRKHERAEEVKEILLLVDNSTLHWWVISWVSIRLGCQPRQVNVWVHKSKCPMRQLMDECFLVLLFQNESSGKTFHMKMMFDLHENEPAGRGHMNGFVIRLVMTQGQKTTQTWSHWSSLNGRIGFLLHFLTACTKI